MYPYNHKRGQTIQTDATGIAVDRGFIANLSWTALESNTVDFNGSLDGSVMDMSIIV